MTEYELYYKIMKYFREFMSIRREGLDLSTENYKFSVRGSSIYVVGKGIEKSTPLFLIAPRLTPKVWYNDKLHSFEFIDDTKFLVTADELYTIHLMDMKDPDLVFQYNTLIPNFIETYMVYRLAEQQRFIVDMSHPDNTRILSDLVRAFEIEKIGSACSN